MPTFIPFPDIPPYPGVPILARRGGAAIAEIPELAIALGSVQNILATAMQQAPRWGIFDQDGNQLGVVPNSEASLIARIGQAVWDQFTGESQTVLSTVSFDFTKETRVSTFPVEGGSFANYNKVESPAAPVVTLALDGTEGDRSIFLSELDDACTSTNLYNIVTPEVNLYNYTIERYSYRRSASRGATLLIVEVYLQEIRQVSATFAKVAKLIQKPQDASATPSVDNGKVQTGPPGTSTLKSIFNSLPSLSGAN